VGCEVKVIFVANRITLNEGAEITFGILKGKIEKKKLKGAKLKKIKNLSVKILIF
jgi:hypothetical protein